MLIFRIPKQHVFPDPVHADPSGLLGVGGDLHPDRLMLAYRSGIFPWYSDDQPILWWSPDPRTVLFPEEFHVSKSLTKTLRKQRFRITFDTAFERVVDACAHIDRPDQEGTWITPEMLKAYTALHAQGHAHSVESWEGDRLVGGVYGVACGQLFSGESMFASSPDASKVAFVHLIEELKARGFGMIDCQVKTEHLTRFGARSLSRSQFLEFVRGMDLSHTKNEERWGIHE